MAEETPVADRPNTANSIEQNIIDLINEANNTTVGLGDLTFSNPEPVEGESPRRTLVTATGVRNRKFKGSYDFFYDRVNLRAMAILTNGQLEVSDPDDLAQITAAAEDKLDTVPGSLTVAGSYTSGDAQVEIVPTPQNLLYIGTASFTLNVV